MNAKERDVMSELVAFANSCHECLVRLGEHVDHEPQVITKAKKILDPKPNSSKWREPRINWRKLLNPSGLKGPCAKAGCSDVNRCTTCRKKIPRGLALLRTPEWSGATATMDDETGVMELRHPSGAVARLYI